MKRFEQYKGKLKELEPTYSYYYLEDGKTHGPFDEVPLDKRLVEKVWENKAACSKRQDEIHDDFLRALKDWKIDLRQEYKNIPDEVFDECYRII